MTEQQAFEAYHRHVTRCRLCKPGEGILCQPGKGAFDSWQAADANERAATTEVTAERSEESRS